MKKRIYFYFIAFQVFLIGIIGFAVINRYLYPKISVSPLNTKYLVFRPVDGLKYFYELKPDTFWPEPTSYLMLLGYPPNSKVAYTINNDGLNQKNNYTEKKPKDVFRIEAIGDSFTFGIGVNTYENYPQQLKNLLSNECKNKTFEVLNLGVVGYDFQYTVERYKIRGQKYNPDLVLWFIIQDDLKRDDEKQIISTTLLNKEIKDTQGVSAAAEDGELHGSWIKAMNRIIEEYGGENNLLRIQSLRLKELNKYFDKKLVTFTFSNTPKNYKNILVDFTKSRQGSYFYGNVPNVPRLNDNHPTKEGYSIIVQNLFEYLTKNKIIPCN